MKYYITYKDWIMCYKSYPRKYLDCYSFDLNKLEEAIDFYETTEQYLFIIPQTMARYIIKNVIKRNIGLFGGYQNPKLGDFKIRHI